MTPRKTVDERETEVLDEIMDGLSDYYCTITQRGRIRVLLTRLRPYPPEHSDYRAEMFEGHGEG